MQLAKARFSKKVFRSWNVCKLPDELIIDILIRLPPKCVTRCKSLCKSLCMIIQTREFIEKYMQQAKPFRYYFSAIKDLGVNTFTVFFTLDGLILEKNMVTNCSRIRNPVTTWNLVLPSPDKNRCYMSMSYLASSERYKVLNLYCCDYAPRVCLDVLTVGVDVTWRPVELPISCVSQQTVSSKTIDGVSYMLRYCHECCPAELLAYQIEGGRFVKIPVPQRLGLFCSSGKYLNGPIEFNKKFGMVVYTAREELHIWGLQDDKNAQWDELTIVIPLSIFKQFPQFKNYALYKLEGTEVFMMDSWLGLHLCYDFKANKLLWEEKLYKDIATSLMEIN